MKGKSLIILGLVVCLGFGLAVSQGEAATTLRVLWFNDADESTVFESAMADFLKANDITLELEIVPFKDYEQKLKMMLAGGNPPDLARVTNNHVATFAKNLQPLNDKLANFAQLAGKYYPSSLALAKAGDKVLALPMEATANGMLVNKTYFQKAGINVDELSKTWTWDEWVDAMKKVMKANEQCRFGIGVDFSPHRWSTLMYQAGGRFLKADLSGLQFQTPEILDTLNFFKMLHDEGLAPKSVWMGSEKPQEMFMAGLVACHIGGSWWINAYAKDIKGFEWGAVKMPKRKIRSSVIGGKFLGTFQGSPNQDVALKVMEAFADPKRTAEYCKGTFNLAPRGDVTVTFPSRAEDFAIMADELSVTPAYSSDDWQSPELNKIYSYIREQIVEGLLGHQTMQDTAKNIEEKGNSFFKK